MKNLSKWALITAFLATIGSGVNGTDRDVSEEEMRGHSPTASSEMVSSDAFSPEPPQVGTPPSVDTNDESLDQVLCEEDDDHSRREIARMRKLLHTANPNATELPQDGSDDLPQEISSRSRSVKRSSPYSGRAYSPGPSNRNRNNNNQ